MEAAYRYTELVCSLPRHAPLFTEPRPPLTRIRFDERLRLLSDEDREEYATVAHLLDWSHLGVERSDAEMVTTAKRRLPELRYALTRVLIERRLQLRTVVAALRRRQRGEAAPPSDPDWGYGRWLPTICRRWNEPHFGLERVYPWIMLARGLLAAGESLELERQLMGVTWADLERHSEGHEFDFEAVLIYGLRWEIVARWSRYNAEAASTRFDYLVREALCSADLDALISCERQAPPIESTIV